MADAGAYSTGLKETRMETKINPKRMTRKGHHVSNHGSDSCDELIVKCLLGVR
jgi:hypothetical protein